LDPTSPPDTDAARSTPADVQIPGLVADRRATERSEIDPGGPALLRMIGAVAARLLTSDEWEREVVRGLRELGGAVRASRNYIFEVERDVEDTLLCSQRYEWTADGVRPELDNPDLQRFPLRAGGFERWEEVLGAGGVISGNVADFPESERAGLEAQGIVSLLVVPIFAGDEWWGFMGFDECNEPRAWSDGEVDALRTAANALGGAVRQRRTAAALQESEGRYRRLVEQCPDAILVRRGERILFANPATFQLLRLGEDEPATDRSIFEFIHLSDAAVVRELIGEAAPPAGPDPLQLRIVRRDGSEVYVEATAHDISWDGLAASQVMLRDITLRRLAEDQARELVREQAARSAAETAEQRARFLDEAATILASSLDYHTTMRSVGRLALSSLADSCIVYVIERNGRPERVEVAHVDDEKESALRDLLNTDPPDAGERRSMISRVFRTGSPELVPEISEEWLRAGALDDDHLERCRAVAPRSALCVPILIRGDVAGAISLGLTRPDRVYGADDLALARELASRAALAIENARLYHEARQASQVKSEFMAVMSHELKTPLTTISTYAELLRDEVLGSLVEPQKQPLDVIVSNSMHLARLIDEVLAFTRTEAMRTEIACERIDASTLAAELIEWVRPSAGAKGLTLELVPAPEPAYVETDLTRLRQIVVNLLTNAVRFTASGGVKVSVERRARRVWIRVADTGIGIAPEHRKSIFDAFWQAEGGAAPAPVRGAGLGLSIVQRLCVALGGGITVDSEVGRGSTFSVWLPAAS
jgi:PAS domain S-box-containing protein